MYVGSHLDDGDLQGEQILLGGCELEIREPATVVAVLCLVEGRLRLGSRFLSQDGELFSSSLHLLVQGEQLRLGPNARRALSCLCLIAFDSRLGNRALVAIVYGYWHGEAGYHAHIARRLEAAHAGAHREVRTRLRLGKTQLGITQPRLRGEAD